MKIILHSTKAINRFIKSIIKTVSTRRTHNKKFLQIPKKVHLCILPMKYPMQVKPELIVETMKIFDGSAYSKTITNKENSFLQDIVMRLIFQGTLGRCSVAAGRGGGRGRQIPGKGQVGLPLGRNITSTWSFNGAKYGINLIK